MARKLLIALSAGVALAALPALLPAATQSGAALAATNINTSKSNNFKVTAVDAKARTFTAVAKDGKQVTFSLPKGALPRVGKVYDVTYTEGSGGGPLQATTVRGSKSNQSE